MSCFSCGSPGKLNPTATPRVSLLGFEVLHPRLIVPVCACRLLPLSPSPSLSPVCLSALPFRIFTPWKPYAVKQLMSNTCDGRAGRGCPAEGVPSPGQDWGQRTCRNLWPVCLSLSPEGDVCVRRCPSPWLTSIHFHPMKIPPRWEIRGARAKSPGHSPLPIPVLHSPLGNCRAVSGAHCPCWSCLRGGPSPLPWQMQTGPLWSLASCP